MRKKLAMSVIMIVAMAAFLTGSAVAAFLDVESSTSNSFQAGTLDLKTDDVDGVTQTLYVTSMKPGATLGPATIVLKNIGSINATTLDIDVSYVNDDGVQPSKYPNTVTDDEFADELIVNTLTYGGIDLLLLVTDVDADGKDMKEVAVTDFSGLTGISSNSTKDFVIQVTMKSTLTNNDFQADGIDMDFIFTLNQ